MSSGPGGFQLPHDPRFPTPDHDPNQNRGSSAPPPPLSGLGSLAQSSRKKMLKEARGILFAVGILTILFTTFLWFQVADVRPQNPAQADAISTVKTACMIAWGEAVVFLVLGCLVYSFPVPATVAGLILYLVDSAFFVVAIASKQMQPNIIGIVIKGALIWGLVKGVKAALAYQREANSGTT